MNLVTEFNQKSIEHGGSVSCESAIPFSMKAVSGRPSSMISEASVPAQYEVVNGRNESSQSAPGYQVISPKITRSRIEYRSTRTNGNPRDNARAAEIMVSRFSAVRFRPLDG